MSNIECSIIIAAWNSSSFILNAVKSALEQKSIGVEVIVVDDLSTDNTCEVVENIDDERVILVRSQCNQGPGGARNLGISKARGKWIAILDSDDIMHSERLRTMIDESPDDAVVLVDNFHIIKNDVQSQEPFFSSSELPQGELSLEYLQRTNLVFTSGKSTGYLKPVILRDFLLANKVEYWPDVRIGEDFYLLTSSAAMGGRIYSLPSIAGYIYNVREGSISSTLNLEHVKKLLESDDKFIRLHGDKLSNSEIIAINARKKNLNKALNYLELVELIKGKKVVKSIIKALSNPFSSTLLWLPIRKRLFER
ncbi:glycosyltransferase family 2 protein [Vibrio lentus]|uniref:Glycosyltransferase 2-like domain-containing protein n=1 Tax=Vibrio lentus TaxID=136468 RepID=A0AA45A8A8_9VIBR|nr:glycosyltransferase family 2 protein [Vibrio lentus]MCB5358427.1 glycosyltransferase family 2 protein [Vibrio lentus]MCB5448895.1 glycosyltransferase family 2 protein [Vibrio lentus]MCB5460782.1 glycosyltransferase family 2 protein [Vibrio lentus]MCC4795156.1 glycosyltransferase [Vibrio lentus]MCC4852279.1 glycosyltransferase [Vibrio lentus]